jgi:hypothetical protein
MNRLFNALFHSVEEFTFSENSESGVIFIDGTAQSKNFVSISNKTSGKMRTYKATCARY